MSPRVRDAQTKAKVAQSHEGEKAMADFYKVGYHLGIIRVLEGAEAHEQAVFNDALAVVNPDTHYGQLIGEDKAAIVRGYCDGARHQCYENFRASGNQRAVMYLNPESYRCEYGVGSPTW
jgi:hypothetical protein